MKINRSTYLITGLIIIACITLIMQKNAYYNYDMPQYIAVAMEYDNVPKHTIHKKVYKELQNYLTKEKFDVLTRPHDTKIFFEEEDVFYETMSYFRAKPLYKFLIYLFNKIGFNIVFSTLIPSIIGLFFIGLILFKWLDKISNPPTVLVALFLIMFSNFVSVLGRFSTPDALSAMFIFSFFYCIRWNKPKYLIALFLWLAIVSRLDNIILLSVGLSYYLLVIRVQLKNKFYNSFLALSFNIILVIFFYLIPLTMGNPDNWLIKFGHIKSFNSYIDHWKTSINYMRFTFLPLLFLLVFLLKKHFYYLHNWKHILNYVFITIGIRLLVFPSFQERFFSGYELVILIFCIEAILNLIEKFRPLKT